MGQQSNQPSSYNVLVMEDSIPDVHLVSLCFRQVSPAVKLHFTKDGVEGGDFLFKRGSFAKVPTPDLILMDLNMPRKDGRTLLKELKADPVVGTIPVVMLSTSNSPEEIGECHRLGASAFVTKPVDVMKMAKIVKTLVEFYFSCASLATQPPQTESLSTRTILNSSRLSSIMSKAV